MANGVLVGLTLIKRWEQCRLNAFIPIPGDPPTIGWGATGPTIKMGDVWTQEEADSDLANRCAVLASQIHSGLTQSITDNQFGAMLSLAYNIGIGNFLSSTLLRKFNAEDVQGAADQFLVWKMAHGQVVQGLLNRREDERNVFLTKST